MESLFEHSISLVSVLVAIVSTAVAWYYYRQEYRYRVRKVVENGRKAGLFLSREAMMVYLSQMYDKAEAGDVIWAQCVRCTNFNRDVRAKILEAAGKGVRFEMVIHQHSPALPEFEALFAPIKSATVVAAPDNVLSLQGLSDKEVVIAFAGMESYTAVVIRDTAFVKLVRVWFEKRHKQCELL